MKLISWNVNGLRSCAGKGFFDFFQNTDADIICLQEIKMRAEQSEFDFGGFRPYWNSGERKGYSGTMTLTKTEPIGVTYGIGIEEHDQEGRVITAEFEGFYLVNVYTPNSKRELERLPYRMTWEDDFQAYLHRLDAGKPVVVCGDLNVAHQEIDIKNAKTNHFSAGFTDQERARMTELLASGFIDTFRHLYPDKKDAYSWWSYMGGARGRNVGWRLDYFLISEKMKGRLRGADILTDVYGSDHCPVELTIE